MWPFFFWREIHTVSKKNRVMKRHIKDFNRFSVNESRWETTLGGKRVKVSDPGAHKSYTVTMNITGEENGISPMNTADIISAAERHDVLIAVESWRGPSGGNTEIKLTGEDEDIIAFLHDAVGDDAELYIEDYGIGM
jgi:hypothetical protein